MKRLLLLVIAACGTDAPPLTHDTSLDCPSPDGLPFPMPVEVKVGETTKRYELRTGTVTIPIAAGQNVVVDPDGWILKAQ